MNDDLALLAQKLAELIPISPPERRGQLILAAMNLAFAMGASHLACTLSSNADAERVIAKMLEGA